MINKNAHKKKTDYMKITVLNYPSEADPSTSKLRAITPEDKSILNDLVKSKHGSPIMKGRRR